MDCLLLILFMETQPPILLCVRLKEQLNHWNTFMHKFFPEEHNLLKQLRLFKPCIGTQVH